MTTIQIEEMMKLKELCEKIAAGIAPPVMLAGLPGLGQDSCALIEVRALPSPLLLLAVRWVRESV